jgi:hypothetical protein
MLAASVLADERATIVRPASLNACAPSSFKKEGGEWERVLARLGAEFAGTKATKKRTPPPKLR